MYLIIGCGSCGCSLASSFWRRVKKEKHLRGMCRPLAINSSAKDLKRTEIVRDFWLGVTKEGELVNTGRTPGFDNKITGGLGKDYKLGSEIFRKLRPYLWESLENNLKKKVGKVMPSSGDGISLAILFFGLGGGTGSSGAPVVGQMLKEKGAKVLGIGVLPSSKQEKDNYTWNAYYSLKNYLSNVDGLILADNNLISKEKELPKLYSMYNDYISGCIFDAVLGPEAEGGKVEHKGMKTVDYTDIINSFSLKKTKGVATAGMFTKSMKLFGGVKRDSDLGPTSVIKNGLNQLTMDVENIEKAKMVWCSVTVHKSLKDKFQFGKLGEELSELVKEGDRYRP